MRTSKKYRAEPDLFGVFGNGFAHDPWPIHDQLLDLHLLLQSVGLEVKLNRFAERHVISTHCHLKIRLTVALQT